MKNEEIRTIIGAPDYRVDGIMSHIPSRTFFNISGTGREQAVNRNNTVIYNVFIKSQDKFYEGDDLSENAYRMSRHDAGTNIVWMRWGHGGAIDEISVNNKAVNTPNEIFNRDRFILANLVAQQCYNDITGGTKLWELGNGATMP